MNVTDRGNAEFYNGIDAESDFNLDRLCHG